MSRQPHTMGPTELKDARARLGLSQREMARRLGVGLSTYSRWENGLTAITRTATLAVLYLLRNEHEERP